MNTHLKKPGDVREQKDLNCCMCTLSVAKKQGNFGCYSATTLFILQTVRFWIVIIGSFIHSLSAFIHTATDSFWYSSSIGLLVIHSLIIRFINVFLNSMVYQLHRSFLQHVQKCSNSGSCTITELAGQKTPTPFSEERNIRRAHLWNQGNIPNKVYILHLKCFRYKTQIFPRSNTFALVQSSTADASAWNSFYCPNFSIFSNELDMLAKAIYGAPKVWSFGRRRFDLLNSAR